MDDNLLLLIGKNIKRFREKKGYDINYLADILNMDGDYLKKIETEGVDGSILLGDLINICNCLDINILQLIKKED